MSKKIAKYFIHETIRTFIIIGVVIILTWSMTKADTVDEQTSEATTQSQSEQSSSQSESGSENEEESLESSEESVSNETTSESEETTSESKAPNQSESSEESASNETTSESEETTELPSEDTATPNEESQTTEESQTPNNNPTEDNSNNSSSNNSTSGGFIGNILDTVEGIVDNVEDFIDNTVDTITDFVTASSTEEIINTTEILPEELTDTATSTIIFTEEETDLGKLVTVSAPNEDPNIPILDVLASTTIPEIYKVGEEDKIQIKWRNNADQEMFFDAYDTDNNNYIDYVEWTIPHLSTQIFEIIFISKAFQLDQNKEIIADIYDIVKTQDNLFAHLSNNQYIRATFEKVLDNTKDITVYARATDNSNPASLEVFPLYEDENGNLIEGSSVATFGQITEEGTYKVFLTNLNTPTDKFDIRASSDLEIDLVVDPIVLPLFTAEQDGPIDDGATYGTTSPGTSGVHFPASGDSVDLAGFDLTASSTVELDTLSDTIGGGSLTIDADLNVTNTITNVPIIVSGSIVTINANIDHSLNTANAIYITSSGSIADFAGVLNNTSSDYAGIYNEGVINEINGTINNQAGGTGILNGNSSIGSISGTVTNSSTGYGIYNDNSTITNVSGTVENNSSGNGIYNYNGSLIEDISGTINNQAGGTGILNDGASISNISGTIYTTGYGIFNSNGGSIGDISGTIDNTGGFSGIYNSGSTITSISGDVTNSSIGYGIHNYSGSWISDISGTIDNTSTGYGIYNESSNITISSTLTLNNPGGGTLFTNNNSSLVNGIGTIIVDYFTNDYSTLDLSSGLTIQGYIYNNGGTMTHAIGQATCAVIGKGLGNISDGFSGTYDMCEIPLTTTIDSCGVITSSGTYTLDADLQSYGNEDCITIRSSDVVLVGNQYSITNAGIYSAIYAPEGYTGITIQDIYINNTGTGSGIQNISSINDISGTVYNQSGGYGIYNLYAGNITDVSGTVNNQGQGAGVLNDYAAYITDISGTINNQAGGTGIYNGNSSINNISGTINNQSVGYGIYNLYEISDISGTINNQSGGYGIHNDNNGHVYNISGTLINSGEGYSIYNNYLVDAISGVLFNFVNGINYGLENTTISGYIINLPVTDGYIWTNSLFDSDWENTSNWLLDVVPNKTTDNIILRADMSLPTGGIANPVYFASDGITLSGGGETIDNSVYSVDGNDDLSATVPSTKGFDVNVANAIITGSIHAGHGGFGINGDGTPSPGGNVDISDTTVLAVYSGTGGDGYEPNGEGDGGSITILNSTVTDVISGNGGSLSIGNVGTAGDGGAITITSSDFNNIAIGSGGLSGDVAGSGGTIIITDSNLDLASKEIWGGVGQVGNVNGLNSSLTLSYTSLTTDTSTYFYDIGTLTINGSNYVGSNTSDSCSNGLFIGETGCDWHGVFNPLIFYYNNATGDEDWNNVLNWWNDADFTIQADFIPNALNQVFINGVIAQNLGLTALADTITFNGTSTNAIDITVSQNVIFNDESENSGTITITSGTSTFYGDDTDTTLGSIIGGFIQRIFTSNATTSRDFTDEGGRDDWFIKAIGNIVVDVFDATYDLANNIFRALEGAIFQSERGLDSNPAGQPTPIITFDLGTTNDDGDFIKWNPVIDWDTATTTGCIYSYDNFATTGTLNCSLSGADLPRPSAGTHDISFRGIDSNGNIAETEEYEFVYDNTSPTYTMCGDDLLDENRSYYYLIEDVTEDCTITASQSTTILKGNLVSTSTGYTVDGDIVGNGRNINLQNISVSGNVDSNGGNIITSSATIDDELISNGGDITVSSSILSATSTSQGGDIIISSATTTALVSTATSTGSTAGSVTVNSSTVGLITANGVAGTNGGNGGIITIATSTTGVLTANGANGTADGGNGGTLTITNSIGDPITAAITANGGSSTSCGDGGDGGTATINSSTYGTPSLEGGDEETSGCPGSNKSSGSRGTTITNGTGHSSQQSQGGGANSTPSSSSRTGTSLRGIVKNINPLIFSPTPSFTPFGAGFSPQTIGGTVIPDPFKNFQPPGSIYLSTLPTNFLTNISKFVFAPIPDILSVLLKNTPQLSANISSIFTSTEQGIANLSVHPEPIITTEEVPGLFVVKSGDSLLTTYATYDKSVGGIAQLIKTSPNQSLTISLIPQNEGEVSATYLGQTIMFAPGTPYVTTYITTPTQGGRYIFTTPGSPTALLIEVIEPIIIEAPKQESFFVKLWKWFQ